MEVSAKEDINIAAAFNALASTIYQTKASAEDRANASGMPNPDDDRGRSISLHQKNRKDSGKKKSGCCGSSKS